MLARMPFLRLRKEIIVPPRKQPLPHDTLLTPAETARRIGIAVGTLRNWASLKPPKGPRRHATSPNHGGRVRYSEREVDAYVETVSVGALYRESKEDPARQIKGAGFLVLRTSAPFPGAPSSWN